MSAFHALDAARAAGVEVRLDRKDLVLSGANAPPADVLDMLCRPSSPSVAPPATAPLPCPLLQPIQPWERDDWQAFFGELVGIVERITGCRD